MKKQSRHKMVKAHFSLNFTLKHFCVSFHENHNIIIILLYSHQTVLLKIHKSKKSIIRFCFSIIFFIFIFFFANIREIFHK